VTREPANDGSGRSYGLELLLARRLAEGAGFGGWLAYSFGHAQREAYGRRYPFDYDRRHALTAVASYRPWSALELSATARLASGFPRNTPRPRVVSAPDDRDQDGDGNRDELVPSLDESGGVRFQLDFDDLPQRGRVRAPLYARLDLRVSFRPRRGRFAFYVDVINATGRRNSLMPEYAWETDEDQGGVRVRAVRGPSLPLLPSLGVHLRF
jgi:outer membrane receptor protein involved in Fe transport